MPAVSKAAVAILALALAGILAGALLYKEGPSPTSVYNETHGSAWHGPYHGLVDTLSRGTYKGKTTVEGAPSPLDSRRPAIVVNGTIVVPRPGEWKSDATGEELCHAEVACIAANASWVRAEGYLAEWRYHGERETVLVAENITVWSHNGTVQSYSYQGEPCEEHPMPGHMGEHEDYHGHHRGGHEDHERKWEDWDEDDGG